MDIRLDGAPVENRQRLDIENGERPIVVTDHGQIEREVEIAIINRAVVSHADEGAAHHLDRFSLQRMGIDTLCFLMKKALGEPIFSKYAQGVLSTFLLLIQGPVVTYVRDFQDFATF